MRDLAVEYLSTFKTFAPEVIADTLAALTTAGFVETPALSSDFLNQAIHLAWWQRALLRLAQVLEWRTTLRHVDAWFTRVYAAGIHCLYTKAGQILQAMLGLAGLAAFFATAARARAALPAFGASLLVVVIPVFLLTILIHEAGHAFTTKAAGCEVLGVGFGWYWFAPTVFVDTSDVWRAGRNQRMQVSAAGPYASFLASGVLSLAAWLIPDARLSAGLWEAALLSYVMVLLCLNPLLDYDGYYVLMDWLERANLRAHAFSWLFRELPQAVRSGKGVRGHVADLLYALGSLIYIAVMCIGTVGTVRTLLPHVSPALAWLPGLLLTILSACSIAAEIRRAA